MIAGRYFLALSLGSLGLLQRTTTLGVVEGVRDEHRGVDAWLGVPYAAPPVGERRWKAPVDHPAWKGVRPAAHFGASCAQLGGFQGPGLREEPFGLSTADAFGRPVGSEDCLSLNLWRPAAATTGLPVIVFLHGGANVAGYTADPLYHGARLAAGANAVVVTLNYRLGVLGWFAHRALDPESGNLGLLDIVKALEFVRANAAAFGGDAGNVTLVGQSAGAVNALALMVSPRGVGLFHRVVALSGALVTAPQAGQHEYSRRVVARLLAADHTAADTAAAARLLAEREPAWVRSYLYSLPTERLVTVAAGAAGGGLPTADGVVLPVDPRAEVRAGRYQAMPLWVGRTAEEGKFFVTGTYGVSDADRLRMMLRFDPARPGRVRAADLLAAGYREPGQFAAAAAKAGAVVNQLIDGTLSLFGAQRQPVYASRFEWARQPEPWREVIGASHGIDLPFLFGNFGPSYYSASFSVENRAGREALSAELMASLAAFARTGVPEVPASGVRWGSVHVGDTRVFDAR